MADSTRTIHSGASLSKSIDLADKSLRLGKIIHIDNEEMTADITWLDALGPGFKLDITAAYAGVRSFLGALPTVGDLVICGFKQGTFEEPTIIQFVVNGYAQGLRNDAVAPSKEFQALGHTDKRYKMQKLYEGEIYASSIYGSEFYLDKNVSISNSVLNEIAMRASDQTISMTSLNNTINAAGVRINSGIIYRNALITHPDFQLPGGISKFPTFYSIDGLPYYTPVYTDLITPDYPYGKQTINNGKLPFTEHKIEIEEFTDPILPVTRENSGVDVDSFYKIRSDGKTDLPLVVQSLGTLVGNDHISKDGQQNYGTILKPRIFADNNEGTKGTLREDRCIVGNGKDETTTLAAAYTLKFPKSGTAFYVNKEGKYFSNIEASSKLDPLGSGESAELNYKGHVKARLGKNTKDQRSLTMYTDGGIRTNFGYDNVKGRSWDATFRKGVFWSIQANDNDKLALAMNITGNVHKIISGSRLTEIKGNDVRVVHGVIEDRVFGKKVDNFINDKATNYGGNYNEMGMGGWYQTIGAGRKVTIFAPNAKKGELVADKLDIIAGDRETNLKLGNDKLNILGGNSTTNITAGNKEISILAGNYTVKITSGDITITTTMGSVNVGTKTGNVTIEGTQGITLKSTATVKIDALNVEIGKMPLGGCVNDGPAGFKCVFSGVPHIGSQKVKCTS